MAEADISHISFGLIKQKPAKAPSEPKKWFETDIVWRNVIIFIILHGLTLYGFIWLWRERRPDIYFAGEYFFFTFPKNLIYFHNKKPISRSTLRNNRWHGSNSRSSQTLVPQSLQSSLSNESRYDDLTHYSLPKLYS